MQREHRNLEFRIKSAVHCEQLCSGSLHCLVNWEFKFRQLFSYDKLLWLYFVFDLHIHVFYFCLLFLFICIDVLAAYMSVHHVHAWCLQRLEKGITCPGAEVVNGCELHCVFWDSNLLWKFTQCLNQWAIASIILTYFNMDVFISYEVLYWLRSYSFLEDLLILLTFYFQLQEFCYTIM